MRTRILVAASEGYDSTTDMADGLRAFLRKHKVKFSDTLLITSRRNHAVYRWASKWSQVSSLDHSSYRDTSADAIRRALVRDAEGAVIFWDGKSAGTRKLIDAVEAKDIPFIVHLV